MLPPNRRQYLLVDKRCRRYSAPDDLRVGFARSYGSEDSEDDSRRSKVSVVDLTILFEDQSGSDSSLELDTSVSYDVSPVPPVRPTTPGCYDCNRSRNDKSFWLPLSNWLVWKIVILAQLMSIALSAAEVIVNNMNQAINPLSANAQNLPLYLYLGLVWTSQLALREGGRGIIQVLRLSGLRYIFLAILHVEATTLTISSLRHHSYMGNQMIDCVAASLSLIIAYVCLEVEFKETHVAGFALAFAGAVGMCAANAIEAGGDDDVTWGDVLRFGSGLFLSFNSIAQELIVKSIDTVEYLGMIGLLGSFVCGFQAIAFDGQTPVPQPCTYWYFLILYSLVQFIFVCLAPKTLRDVGTTGMHLALISSTFYTRILQCLFNAEKQLFFISYFSIIMGSFLFAMKRTSINKHYFYPVQVTLSRHDS